MLRKWRKRDYYYIVCRNSNFRITYKTTNIKSLEEAKKRSAILFGKGKHHVVEIIYAKFVAMHVTVEILSKTYIGQKDLVKVV